MSLALSSRSQVFKNELSWLGLLILALGLVTIPALRAIANSRTNPRPTTVSLAGSARHVEAAINPANIGTAINGASAASSPAAANAVLLAILAIQYRQQWHSFTTTSPDHTLISGK
jgi:hypothetical protein